MTMLTAGMKALQSILASGAGADGGLLRGVAAAAAVAGASSAGTAAVGVEGRPVFAISACRRSRYQASSGLRLMSLS